MNFKPVSEAPKLMKIAAKPSGKHAKNDLKVNRIPTPAKSWLLHTISHQTPAFPTLHDQIQTRKSQQKESTNKHGKQAQVFFFQSAGKVHKTESRHLPKIDKNPTPDAKVSLLLFLWPPRVPPSCPNPRATKWRHQACQLQFRATKMTALASKIIIVLKRLPEN